eukprot:gene19083-38278_t
MLIVEQNANHALRLAHRGYVMVNGVITMSGSGKDLLAKGIWIIMFPEGTRIPRGQTGTYKLGGTRLAVATGAPVIPVAVTSAKCWPRKAFIKTPGVVEVSIGKPIPSQGREPKELMEEVQAWIESEMRRLDPGAYLGETRPPGGQRTTRSGERGGMTFSIHGLAVSRGIAIGRAVLVASSRVDVAHYFVKPDQVDAEIGRVRAGRDAVVDEIHRLQESITRMGPKEAPQELSALLDVHLMLLQDEELVAG